MSKLSELYEMDPGSGIQNSGSGFWDPTSRLSSGSQKKLFLLRAIRRFRRQIAAGALIQTNTTSFITFRMFLNFHGSAFIVKIGLYKRQIKTLMLLYLKGLPYLSPFFLLQKVSNSFLQHAKGYMLPPAKSKKIRENKSVLHAVLHYPLALC